MTKLNWLGLGIIGVAGVALPKALSFAEYALSNPTTLSSKNSGSVQAQNNNSELTETQNNGEPSQDSPRRLTITVRVARPEDLKVIEGDTIKAGQVIADRERERSRLNSQKQQLQLSLQRLQSSTITPPTPPRQVPAIKALPPVSYSEHQAGIEKAKAAGSRSECLRQRLGRIRDRNQEPGNRLPQGTTQFRPHHPRTRTGQTQETEAQPYSSSERLPVSRREAAIS